MPSRASIRAHRLLGSMVRHLAITSPLSSPPQGSAQALNPHAPAPSSNSALDISVIEPGDLAFLPSRPSFCSLDRVLRRSFDSASEKAVSSTHRRLLDCPPIGWRHRRRLIRSSSGDLFRDVPRGTHRSSIDPSFHCHLISTHVAAVSTHVAAVVPHIAANIAIDASGGIMTSAHPQRRIVHNWHSVIP